MLPQETNFFVYVLDSLGTNRRKQSCFCLISTINHMNMQGATEHSSLFSFDMAATHESRTNLHPLLSLIQTNHLFFQQSPELLVQLLQSLFVAEKKPTLPERKKILLPQGHGFTLIDEEDIVYLEADGSYTRVFLRDGQRLMVSRALKEFVGLLSPTYFERIHKSHIINLRYLKTYSRLQGGCVKMEDGTELLISRRRLSGFLEKMSQITLSFSK